MGAESSLLTMLDTQLESWYHLLSDCGYEEESGKLHSPIFALSDSMTYQISQSDLFSCFQMISYSEKTVLPI